jgi:hypothetical protein
MVQLLLGQRYEGYFHCWLLFSIWIIVQTPGLWQYDPKTSLPLFHTTAYVPSRYPCEMPSVCHLNSSAPIMHNPPIPQNLCDDVMHTFHAETKVCTIMPKHYTTITLQLLIHFGMCVWDHNVGWRTKACQVLSAAPTLSEHLAPTKHCCMLQSSPYTRFIREWMCWSCTFHTQKLDDEACLSSTKQHAIVQRSHIAACLWHVPILLSSDRYRTEQEWLTLHYT